MDKVLRGHQANEVTLAPTDILECMTSSGTAAKTPQERDSRRNMFRMTVKLTLLEKPMLEVLQGLQDEKPCNRWRGECVMLVEDAEQQSCIFGSLCQDRLFNI